MSSERRQTSEPASRPHRVRAAMDRTLGRVRGGDEGEVLPGLLIAASVVVGAAIFGVLVGGVLLPSMLALGAVKFSLVGAGFGAGGGAIAGVLASIRSALRGTL